MNDEANLNLNETEVKAECSSCGAQHETSSRRCSECEARAGMPHQEEPLCPCLSCMARTNETLASLPTPRLVALRDAVWGTLESFGPKVRRDTATQPTYAEFLVVLRKRSPDLTADFDDHFLAVEYEEALSTQDFIDGETDEAFERGLVTTHENLGRYTDAEFVRAFRSEYGNVLSYRAYRTERPQMSDEAILQSLAEILEFEAKRGGDRERAS